MARTNTNPFQACELYLPRALQKEITELVHREGKDANLEFAPLYRTVDFWFVAACMAIEAGNAAETGDGAKGWKFNTGVVLRDNKVRIELMQLAAIGVTEDPYIIKEPGKIANLFNDCAALGAPELLDLVKTGQDKPLWNLIGGLRARTKP